MGKYRHYVRELPVVGDYTEVFPLGFQDIKLNHVREEGLIFFRRVIEGDLIFSNRTETVKDIVTVISDYTFFNTIENTNRCQLYEYKIEQECENEYTPFWYGTFGTIDGRFDLDRCTFTMTPNSKDSYACLLTDLDINIMSTPTPVEINVDSNEPLNDRVYENCRNFDAVLDYVATHTCPDIQGIVSDFFQINPENVSDINYVTQTENLYTEMAFGSMQDIREPIPSLPALAENITFRQLMDELRILFNVYWFIDENENVRIEHITYFFAQAGLDLTLAEYQKFISGTRKYSYNQSDSPKFEVWSMNNSDMGGTISIDSVCGSLQSSFGKNTVIKGTTKKYALNKIYTDYYRVFYEPDKLPSDNTGLFLFATYTDTDRYMFGFVQNEELVLPRLVLRFHRHDRPQLNCDFTYNPTPVDYTQQDYGDFFVYTEKPIKIQEPFKIKLCCDDDYAPEEYLTTNMGTGYIQRDSLSLKTDTLELGVAYRPNDDNVDITDPTEIDDLALWLRADLGVTIVSGRVSSWADQSGNGRDATQATAALRPILVANEINGESVIRFASDAATMAYNLLTTPSFQSFPSNSGSLFFVCKKLVTGDDFGQILGTFNGVIDADAKWDVSFNIDGVDGNYKYYTFNYTLFYPGEGGIGTTLTPTGDAKKYGWTNEFLMFYMQKTASDNSFIWHNAKEVDAANGNPIMIDGPPLAMPINIGADSLNVGPTTTSGLNGDIAEIILFDRALTNIERQRVEQYLSKRYALNLYQIS